MFFSSPGSRLQKRKIKSIAFYVACWMFFSLLFFLFHFYGQTESEDPVLYTMLFQFALLTGLSHGIYDVIVLQDNNDQRSIPVTLFFRLVFFASTVLVNLSISILIFSWYKTGAFIDEEGFEMLYRIFSTSSIQAFALYGILIGFFITFIRSVNKKFGTDVFFNTLLGKTQEPKEAELVFLFVDLRDSTSLAEKMGHIKYSQFMKEYYRLLSNCCEENGGDIYQIAGDGAYLTWPSRRCLRKARPVLCFEDLKRCFFRTRERFLSKFGHAPEFKGAAHLGKVIMTEVGNYRSEKAYHGDAVNTTSRLQDLCRGLGEEFLISRELLEKLPNIGAYDPLPKGPFELKGKSSETYVYALHFPDPALEGQKKDTPK